MRLIGIYQIRNLINNKIYIGSSNDILQRWRGHRRELNSNIHSNLKLQNAWNKYGGKNFVFEVLEQISLKSLRDREQDWMNLKLFADCDNDLFNELGYNISRLARANNNSPLRGELNGKSKLSKLDIKNIFREIALYNTSGSVLAQKYQVTSTKICQIVLGQCWKHLTFENEPWWFKILEIRKNGRVPSGAQRKLSDNDIRSIIKLLQNKDKAQIEIAKLYNVHQSVISRIKTKDRLPSRVLKLI